MKKLFAYNFNSPKKFVMMSTVLPEFKLKKKSDLQRLNAIAFLRHNLMAQRHLFNSPGVIVCKLFFKCMFLFLLCAFIYFRSSAQQGIFITPSTTANSPVNPVLSQYISSGGITFSLLYGGEGPSVILVKVLGRIVRNSPAPSFVVTTIPGYVPPQSISLTYGVQTPVMSFQLSQALGNLAPGLLTPPDVVKSLLDRNNNIRLPAGNYSICFDVYRTDSTGILGPLLQLSGEPPNNCGQFDVTCPQSTNGALVNTIVRSPVPPVIDQMISGGSVNSTIQFTDPTACSNTPLKLFGKIERISPSPFTIMLRPDYIGQQSILLSPGSPRPLSVPEQRDAFGNFIETNLVSNGIDLASIRDANNRIKLPDGNYRICYYARYFNSSDLVLEGNASDPNLGCGAFTICYQAGGAPQFTQPVSNLDINADISVVQPASPLIFTWTPPQSACGLPAGGFTYDFEIRQLFANQNVTDAINNPFVFRKTGLPSTTFILDTNLNKNVLHEGQRYAIRVRAVSTNANSPVEIDNNGYSRIEAFQYGGNIITHNGFHYEPEDYYIPFIERKSDFWDDVYSSYRKRTRGDTLVPVKEYIAFALTQNLTGYSLDAIELFLALNPELAELKKVKISYTPKLPEFPSLPSNDQNNFDKEHEINLEPDKSEENKFLKYLDTLNNFKQKIPDNAAKMISDLVSHLNSIKTEVDSMDRVSVNLVLSELLYELHKSSQGLNKSQLNQLQGLVSTLRELTAASSGSTSFFYRFPGDKRSSLSSYQPGRSGHTQKVSFVNNALQINDDSPDHLLSVIMKQLLPFDVIVYRYTKGTPAQPLLDAPDLSRTYRVFYALQNLYNHKNPEVNAKSSTHLASTVQVSLPSNTIFTFWTLNMLSHKNTKPEDVDLKDVLSHTNKVLPGLKKPSIVLKVE
jgi:hypothetical protein